MTTKPTNPRDLLKTAEEQYKLALDLYVKAQHALEECEAQVREWRNTMEALRSAVGGRLETSAKAAATRSRPVERSPRVSLTEMAERILRDAGRPLNYRELAEMIQKQRGQRVVHTRLYSDLIRRKNRFTRVAPGMFDLEKKAI